jgi:hypothetical protein
MNLQTASQMSAPFTGFDSHLQIVLLILLGCGILGGIGNYFLRDPDAGQDAKGWLRYPVLGVVAALTAPLVLSMLSSNLVEAGRTRATDYLVLAGFVLFYVVLSRRLFDSATLRLLGRTERLHKDLARVRAGIEQIQAQPAKVANGGGHAPTQAKGPANHEHSTSADAEHNQVKEALTHADVELLRAVAKEDIVYGNLADLVDRSGVSRELALQRVAILKSWGALDTRMNEKQILQWIVTPKGKQMLADLLR